MASGEIRLSTTTTRQMPVLAQSQSTGDCDAECQSLQVTVNARQIVPNDTYGPAAVGGNFSCGTATCSYQMGLYNIPGSRGVWLNVNVSGKSPNSKWVQTFIDSNRSQFTPDCGASCPFYPSYASGNQWFFDDPARAIGSSVTWVAQTSYIQAGSGGAAFTFQWGFQAAANGAISYIQPVAVSPWPAQQQLIGVGP